METQVILSSPPGRKRITWESWHSGVALYGDRRAKGVANAGDGKDIAGAGRFWLNLLAQVANMGLYQT